MGVCVSETREIGRKRRYIECLVLFVHYTVFLLSPINLFTVGSALRSNEERGSKQCPQQKYTALFSHNSKLVGAFTPIKPQRITPGPRETFIKKYIVERTNEAER